MAVPQTNNPAFPGLFAAPTLPRLLSDLDADTFEHFVAYVFQQAGYVVEYTAHDHGPGLDLMLYTGSPAAKLPRAGVQVKHFIPTHKVGAPEVVGLRGGLPAGGDLVGYFVTTSGFHGPALAQAGLEPRIWPIDGEHLLRYITYIRGSRPRVNAGQSFPPPGYPLAPIHPEALFEADAIERRPPATTKILTLANHKGGVGKTTSALNLAFGLMAQDRQVLLVDMDTQRNLTRVLAHPQAAHAELLHLGDYFAGRRPLKDLVRQTQFPRVWLLPSDHSLTLSETGVAAGPEAELRFVRDLHAADLAPPHQLDARPFDWIIIDTSPSMGFFTRSALAASHVVVMPIAPSVFADMGWGLLKDAIDTMSALMGTSIVPRGALVTQWRDDALNRDLVKKAKTELELSGVPLIEPYVPYDKSHIEKAHLETGDGKKKTLFSHKCAAAQAYTDIVEKL